MEEVKEVTIRIKGEDKSTVFKHLIYDEMMCSEDDPTLKMLIRGAKDEFVGEIEQVTITIKMVL